ncbi:hypothetical protein [Halolactibacillus miurensis]|uniref:Extracellular solute-binding protein n=1 Tax=Halolactibacillus miurensis TaxID=306541 RepID=A0A1I6U0Y6_9BACI|nr:hypothetical protein [Halolactibacillus miurensis]SFS95081.1 hypothetical protein SAMN05421668_12038 [Halolactibacillus miurensis]
MSTRPSGLVTSVCAEGMQVKLKEAFQGMTTKEKVDYVWEYYKGIIIGSLCFLLFIWLMVDGFMSKDEEPVVVTILSRTSLAGIEEIEEAFSHETFDVYVDHIYHENGKIPENGMQSIERLSTSLAVGQIDLFVIDQTMAELMMLEEVLAPIDDMIDTTTIQIDQQDQLILENDWYGIRASTLSELQSLEKSDQLYVFIPATARHVKKIEQLLK